MSITMDSEVGSKSIVKSILIRRIAEKCKGTYPKDIETAIKCILDRMHQTLRQGGRIEIRGFATFSLRFRAPRKAHNPRTGEKVETKGKYFLYFRAGKDFKWRINTVEHAVKEVEEALV